VIEHRVSAAYPQIGVLQSGEARVRAVFGGRAGPDGDRRAATAGCKAGRQVAVTSRDGRLDVGGQRRGRDALPDQAGSRRDRRGVRSSQPGDLAADRPGGVDGPDRALERPRRDHEPGRDGQASPDELTEARALAADRRPVSCAYIADPADQVLA
jgi:hypothetical protein